MAALELQTVDRAPWGYSLTGVGLSWQEIKIPEWGWLRYNASDQVYMAYKLAGDPASVQTQVDGAAVGTHKSTVGNSGSPTGWVIADFANLPQAASGPNAPKGQARSVFIAAVSGTVNIDVEVIHPSQVS